MLLEMIAGLAVGGAVYLTMSTMAYGARLRQYVPEGPQGEVRPNVWKRIAPRIATQALGLAPAGYVDQVRTALRQGGYFAPVHVQAFLAVQVILALAGGMAGALTGGRQAPVWLTVAAALGLLLPWVWLKLRIRVRQEALNNVLPDTLDLLTSSVEAGLGLDAAIGQVSVRANKTSWAMNQELSRYMQETRMGVPRPDALRSLGARSGLEDLRHVVTALIQGDMLGVGVAQILRAQTMHIRMKRKQRAEEKAMKAPIKILFPLLFGIFPAIFVLILGPALIKIVDGFASRSMGF